jgi:hypothetical protein
MIAKVTHHPATKASGATDELKIVSLGTRAYQDLADKYRLLADDSGEYTIAQIIAPGVLRCVKPEDVIYCDLIKRYGTDLKPSKIKSELYHRWYSEMRTQQGASLAHAAVKPFHFRSAPSSAGFAWQRLAWDPDPQAAAPKLFLELLSHTTPDEAHSLKIFIGSLFDFKSSRHQYLYLHGNGGGGKSTLIDAMSAMFNKMGYRTMQGDSLDREHSTAGLEGVRLLAFPDCNRPSLPSTGIFKQLTGDDVTTINPKHMNTRNITMHCKVVISGNDVPQLTGGTADYRRIVPVSFVRHESTSNDQWKVDFIASAPQIAQHCIAVYEQWRTANPGVELPSALKAKEVVENASLESTAQDLVATRFECGEDFTIVGSDLEAYIDSMVRSNNQLKRQVYKALKAVEGVASGQGTAPNRRRVTIWRGIRPGNGIKVELNP